MRFKSLHPIVLALYYVMAASLMMLAFHPIYLLSGSLLLLIIHKLLQTVRELKKWWKPLTVMAVFLLVVTPLVNRRGEHLLFYFQNQPVMLEAVIKGISHAFGLIGLFFVFLSFHFVVRSSTFLYLFTRFFQSSAVVVMLTLRFVPLFKKRLEMISTIHQMKRVKGIKPRLKQQMGLIEILLSWSLEEALDTADSMAARGYGSTKRTAYDKWSFKRTEIIQVSFLIILFSLFLYGRIQGAGYLTVYPHLELTFSLQTEWQTLLSFVALLSFPLFVEWEDAFRWKLSNLKM